MNFGRAEWSPFLFPLKWERQPQEERHGCRHRAQIPAMTHRLLGFKPKKALFRFGRFHSSWKLSAGMFCRETCHPGRAIFSFNSSSFPRKANIPPNLSLPVVTTPEANANLSPSTEAAHTEEVLPLVGRMEAGLLHSRCSDSPRLCLPALWRTCPTPPMKGGDRHVKTALGSASDQQVSDSWPQRPLPTLGF